jgi:hypothetical protein
MERKLPPPNLPHEKSPAVLGWFDTLKEKVVVGGKLVSDKVAESTKSLKGNAGEGRKIENEDSVGTKSEQDFIPSNPVELSPACFCSDIHMPNRVDPILVSGTCLRLFWMC